MWLSGRTLYIIQSQARMHIVIIQIAVISLIYTAPPKRLLCHRFGDSWAKKYPQLAYETSAKV